LDKFWKQVNYKEYDFKFTTYGNTDMILTIFDKHSNPRATSKAVFQVENQKVIKNFITDIIDSISGEYIEHKVFVIYKGTINSNESINVCLNTQSMKKILKDYTGTIYGLGYKN
jgi:hypothetical protein